MAKNVNDARKPLTVSIRNFNYNTSGKSSRSDDDFDGVKVEVRTFNHTVSTGLELHQISDLDNSCANPTTISLMHCKKQIMHPFRKLLCLIGWRPFYADSLHRSSICVRIMNILYPIFILLLLIFNYAYEIVVCEGKLNVITDTRTTTSTTTITTRPTAENHTLLNWSSLLPPTRFHTPSPPTAPVCGHIFTTYILPDLLHFAAFIIGFIYFRVTEGEPIYSLMEKVFIHADQNVRRFSSNRVIRRLKIFLLIGIIWVILCVGTYALSHIHNDFSHQLIFHTGIDNPKESLKYILFVIDLLCLLVSNCIHLATVMNFVGHCELIIFYCKAIRTRLEEKSLPLEEAMKQILDLGSSISQLNSAVSRTMSILIIYFLERTILGIILLVLNEIQDPLFMVYRAMYPVVWCSVLLFCLSQAARVTSKCDKFHRISLSIRVFGYQSATPSELDGFLLFLSQSELRAKLFGLTVRPGKIIFLVVTSMIIAVFLLQTNIIAGTSFFLQ